MDLKFLPRATVKAQALSDFLAELSFSETTAAVESSSPSIREEAWTMMVDRAVNSKGVGVDIMVTSPTGQHKRACSVKFDYPLLNNQVEYEALIVGMKWVLATGISTLRVFSDSQVIVSQVNNEYVVHSDNLKEYTEKVPQLITQFRYFTLEKVDQSNNEMADKFAKIASGETPNDMEIEIELYPSLAHIQPLQSVTCDPPTWVDELMNYISLDILPDDKERARHI